MITSPFAASTLSEYPLASPIASVGKGTTKVLKKAGFHVSFEPSVANGQTLAEELPLISGEGKPKVLYPCSNKASTDVEDGLESKGCEVIRLPIYDTLPTTFTLAEDIDVVMFASPTAVKGWTKNTEERPVAVCIGETSGMECLRQGWEKERVRWPSKPGVENWGKLVGGVVEEIEKKSLN